MWLYFNERGDIGFSSLKHQISSLECIYITIEVGPHYLRGISICTDI